MLDIMKYAQNYFGNDCSGTAPSGSLLTCKRQRCAQRHMMDSDIKVDWLELLQPFVEDWHTLMCLLEVSASTVNLLSSSLLIIHADNLEEIFRQFK